MLRERLDKVERQRVTQRRARGGALSVSLVGYTNAGKSTLFNALTRADSYAADQLFATLDTTTRRIWIEGAGSVVVSDTVGFIRDLPHGLIAAFRATLEETVHADLLLHVVDAASPQRDEQIFEVNKVLAEIGAAAIPTILVYNKIDRAGLEPRVERDAHGTIARVFVSATERAGLDALRGAIAEIGQIVGNNASNFQTIHLNDPGWGRGNNNGSSRRPRPQNGGDGPPDLDEVWRDFNNRIGSLFGRKGGGETTVLATVAACSRLRRAAPASAWASLPWSRSASGRPAAYIVQEGQVAVVTQFGKYKSTSQAGFQWRLPYPIQSHETVNVSQLRSKSVSAAARATRCCPRR